MTVYTNLFERICSFENLYLAYRKARKGKRGVASTASFEYDQEGELLRLRAELLAGEWRPGPYHSFYIHDPKKRLISAAPFRDRVVHHALCNLIEPIWERKFIIDSYANRVGKGTHRALLRANEYTRRYKYVLQCDIEQFFPTIDHAILYPMLAKWIDDPPTLEIIRLILDSGIGVQAGEYKMRGFPGDDPSTPANFAQPGRAGSGQGLFAVQRPRGLPIGNLTSQFWANVYLNPFDHFVKRELRCKAYLRYVDDFLLFADDRKTLTGWQSAIAARLQDFRLTMHEPQVYPLKNGVPFLGFVIYPHHRRLKKKRGIAFQRRFCHRYQQWVRGEIERKRLDDAARSWAAHASWGDTYALRGAVLGKYILSQNVPQAERIHAPLQNKPAGS